MDLIRVNRTIGRMAANTALDFFVGTVPVLGDAFDLIYKANKRSFALLRDELADQPLARSSKESS